MENSLHKNVLILLWCNLVGIFLFGGGSMMLSYLASSHQGTAGAWRFLFAIIGLCLFGYGLVAYRQVRAQSNGLLTAMVWLSVINGILGFIFAFVANNALGIVTGIISAVAFICALVAANSVKN